MKPFTIDWTDDTLDQLAYLYLNASDPLAITAAQARIDSLLHQNPLQRGAEISEGLRELCVPPLRVPYSVEITTSRVEVVAVKRSS
jgi:hypothetical protein